MVHVKMKNALGTPCLYAAEIILSPARMGLCESLIHHAYMAVMQVDAMSQNVMMAARVARLKAII